MASTTPIPLYRIDPGQVLQPAQGRFDAQDAAGFAPNQTFRFGQAIGQNSTTKLLYPYSSATLTAPPAPTLTVAPTGGTLPAATYYYKVVAQYGSGNSAAGAEANATTTGTTSAITVAFAALPGATGYNLYRSTATGTETLLVNVPPPQNPGVGSTITVTYADTGAVAPGTATPPNVSAAATDGTQTCIGLSKFSFVTDAGGTAFLTFSNTPNSPAYAGASEFSSGEPTMPVYYRGVFDPRDLVGFDAAAQAQMGARTLPDGNVLIP